MRRVFLVVFFLHQSAAMAAPNDGRSFMSACQTDIELCAAYIRAMLPNWPEYVIHPPYTKDKTFDLFRCPTFYTDRKLRDVFMSRAYHFGLSGEGQTAERFVIDVMTLAAPVCAGSSRG